VKPTAILVFSFLFCFGAAAQDRSASDSPKLSLHDRVWIATQIYSSVSANFAHWRGVPNLDFDKEFHSYLDHILADDDRRNFDMATLALVAKLENGHTRFLDKWFTANFGAPLGFTLRPIGSSWVVTESQIADVHPATLYEPSTGRPLKPSFTARLSTLPHRASVALAPRLFTARTCSLNHSLFNLRTGR
jgi:hypothetical protein